MLVRNQQLTGQVNNLEALGLGCFESAWFQWRTSEWVRADAKEANAGSKSTGCCPSSRVAADQLGGQGWPSDHSQITNRHVSWKPGHRVLEQGGLGWWWRFSWLLTEKGGWKRHEVGVCYMPCTHLTNIYMYIHIKKDFPDIDLSCNQIFPF